MSGNGTSDMLHTPQTHFCHIPILAPHSSRIFVFRRARKARPINNMVFLSYHPGPILSTKTTHICSCEQSMRLVFKFRSTHEQLRIGVSSSEPLRRPSCILQFALALAPPHKGNFYSNFVHSMRLISYRSALRVAAKRRKVSRNCLLWPCSSRTCQQHQTQRKFAVILDIRRILFSWFRSARVSFTFRSKRSCVKS